MHYVTVSDSAVWNIVAAAAAAAAADDVAGVVDNGSDFVVEDL